MILSKLKVTQLNLQLINFFLSLFSCSLTCYWASLRCAAMIFALHISPCTVEYLHISYFHICIFFALEISYNWTAKAGIEIFAFCTFHCIFLQCIFASSTLLPQKKPISERKGEDPIEHFLHQPQTKTRFWWKFY